MLEKYRLTCKILSTAALVLQGLYYSFYYPGMADVISGAIVGLTLYCLWFNKDRVK